MDGAGDGKDQAEDVSAALGPRPSCDGCRCGGLSLWGPASGHTLGHIRAWTLLPF